MSLAENIRVAAAGGGLLLAGMTFVAGNFSGGYVEPAGRLEDLLPSSPSEKPCPSGWQNTSAKDLHLVVNSCSRGEWRVILQSDGTFSHARQGDASEFVFDPARVPDWPRQ